MKKHSFELQDAGVSESIKRFINANIDEFRDAFSFSQRDQNDRVEVGKISVKDIRVLANGTVEIEYEYEWSFYSGCKDISDAGIDSEMIEARLVGGVVELAVPEQHEPRTTLDEF